MIEIITVKALADVGLMDRQIFRSRLTMVRRTDIKKDASLMLRTAGGADSSAMKYEEVRQVGPLFLLSHVHEVPLDLYRIALTC